jgi:hypothetical protein
MISSGEAESPGVGKLIEFLNATRRQAELSINNLNEKIQELTAENEYLQKEYDETMVERNHYKQLAETLEQASGTKARLRERDDWKSLVESIQSDRSRLQDECNSIAEELEQARHQIELLNQQKATETGITSWFLEHEPINGQVTLPDSPSSTVRRLRQENEELRNQLAEERRSSNAEISSLNYEIAKLQDELAYYKRHSSPSVPNYQPGSEIKYVALSSSSSRMMAVNGPGLGSTTSSSSSSSPNTNQMYMMNYPISRPPASALWALNPINILSQVITGRNSHHRSSSKKSLPKELISILHV